jgi:hypothetical protein
MVQLHNPGSGHRANEAMPSDKVAVAKCGFPNGCEAKNVRPNKCDVRFSINLKSTVTFMTVCLSVAC